MLVKDYHDYIGTYNVKDFGAVADGVTDDQPAIQAAYDAANTAYQADGYVRTVFFPDGKYVVKDSIYPKNVNTTTSQPSAIFGAAISDVFTETNPPVQIIPQLTKSTVTVTASDISIEGDAHVAGSAGIETAGAVNFLTAGGTGFAVGDKIIIEGGAGQNDNIVVVIMDVTATIIAVKEHAGTTYLPRHVEAETSGTSITITKLRPVFLTGQDVTGADQSTAYAPSMEGIAVNNPTTDVDDWPNTLGTYGYVIAFDSGFYWDNAEAGQSAKRNFNCAAYRVACGLYTQHWWSHIRFHAERCACGFKRTLGGHSVEDLSALYCGHASYGNTDGNTGIIGWQSRGDLQTRPLGIRGAQGCNHVIRLEILGVDAPERQLEMQQCKGNMFTIDGSFGDTDFATNAILHINASPGNIITGNIGGYSNAGSVITGSTTSNTGSIIHIWDNETNALIERGDYLLPRSPGSSDGSMPPLLIGNSTYYGLGAFNVKDFGAVGDGTTDDQPAIQEAIAAANTAGGGEVHCPAPGSYLIDDTLDVLDGVNLVIQRGAEIYCDTNIDMLDLYEGCTVSGHGSLTRPTSGDSVSYRTAHIRCYANGIRRFSPYKLTTVKDISINGRGTYHGTGIYLFADKEDVSATTNSAVGWVNFDNIAIRNVEVCILARCDEDLNPTYESWVNANMFSNLRITSFNNFFITEMNGTSDDHAISGNKFVNIGMQCNSSMSSYTNTDAGGIGTRIVYGVASPGNSNNGFSQNEFRNMHVWDWPSDMTEPGIETLGTNKSNVSANIFEITMGNSNLAPTFFDFGSPVQFGTIGGLRYGGGTNTQLISFDPTQAEATTDFFAPIGTRILGVEVLETATGGTNPTVDLGILNVTGSVYNELPVDVKGYYTAQNSEDVVAVDETTTNRWIRAGVGASAAAGGTVTVAIYYTIDLIPAS